MLDFVPMAWYVIFGFFCRSGNLIEISRWVKLCMNLTCDICICLKYWCVFMTCSYVFLVRRRRMRCQPVRLMTHIVRICGIFDVVNLQRYCAGFAPMLFQWSHAHIAHFFHHEKSRDKNGSRAKNHAIKKIVAMCVMVLTSKNGGDRLPGRVLGGGGGNSE